MSDGVFGAPVERRELFRGRPMHWNEAGRHAFGAVLAAGGAILAITGVVIGVMPLVPVGIVFSCAGGAIIFSGWLKVVTVAYRVDTLRVEVESGIVSKKIDNLELWRVKDLQFRQGIVQRILDAGDVVLVTSDATNPRVVIGGIKGARDLYEKLRDAVDAARRGKGVLGVEQAG